MTKGLSFQEISNNRSLSPSSSTSNVVFRVDLASGVKFREDFTKAKSKTRKIMAWAKVEVDPITGKKIRKEPIELKHMIKHHVNGRVNVLFAFFILAAVLSPCWCYCFMGYFCKLIGH